MLASLSVIILAVSSMCMNHLILPFRTRNETHIFQNIDTIKRILIVIITLTTYVTYLFSHDVNALNGFGYASYTAVFQFLPGILAVLYWPTGNRLGLLLGVLVGFSIWTITILFPLFSIDSFGLQALLQQLLSLEGDNYWFLAAATSLGANMLTFGLVSIFTKTDEEQRYISQICSQDDLGKPRRQELKVKNIDEFIQGLTREINTNVANREINNALKILNIQRDETRPFALRLVRRQVESNLSGLYGPTVARQIVTRALPYLPSNPMARDDIHIIEHRLERTQSNLTGLAAELDKLRRYHRNTIENLPIGICSFDNEHEILIWNSALHQLTKVSPKNAIGAKVDDLPEPWRTLLLHFIDSEQSHLHKAPLQLKDQQRWYTLHKTILHNDEQQNGNQSVLIEDVTPTALLEQELLHNERLASIGRLAAGVAHEIGNPITGIACLAQNLKYDSDSPAINETAKDILQQTERVTRIVQSLVNFSHSGSHGKQQNFEAVDLYLCIDDAIHLLSLNDNKAKQIINNQVPIGSVVHGDTQSLLQVFINLIKNALQAIEGDGEITISCENLEHNLEIRVSDTGSGISKDIQGTIFEPFFTTKDPGVGTGLGLALVYSIIEEHHGSIAVSSPLANSDHGTCFTLRLPKQAASLP
jgi:signal transduction histidine kinase